MFEGHTILISSVTKSRSRSFRSKSRPSLQIADDHIFIASSGLVCCIANEVLQRALCLPQVPGATSSVRPHAISFLSISYPFSFWSTIMAQPDLQRVHKVVLQRALHDRKLFVLIGSGVPINAIRGAGDDIIRKYTWKGVVKWGLEWVAATHPHLRLICDGRLTELQHRFVRMTDTASFIATYLKPPQQQSCWNELFDPLRRNHPGGLVTHADILDTVHELRRNGARLFTTNYDVMLETSTPDRLQPLRPGSHDRATATTWLQDSRTELKDEYVYHIHGIYTNCESMVLDDLSYAQIEQDETLSAILRAIFLSHVVLCVGCGLLGGMQDSHVGPLLQWLQRVQGGAPSRLYFVLPSLDPDLPDPALVEAIHGAPVNVLFYGHNRDEDLVPFLRGLFDLDAAG